jgi:hypothetical protein
MDGLPEGVLETLVAGVSEEVTDRLPEILTEGLTEGLPVTVTLGVKEGLTVELDETLTEGLAVGVFDFDGDRVEVGLGLTLLI